MKQYHFQIQMKLIFLSNFYNHHQEAVCKAWYALTGTSYCFVSTESFSEERKAMGWDATLDAPFVIHHEDIESSALDAMVVEADAVIYGSVPQTLVATRLKQGKIVFAYSERLFKRGYDYKKWFPRLLTFWWHYGRHRSLFLLTASAYTAADFAKHGTFIGKAYQWGYFPYCKHYDVAALLSSKIKHRILWCGRFLPWKHPDTAIDVARRLKASGYDFELRLIGTGEMEDILRNMISEADLSSCVQILGAMSPEQVREQMEQAGIYLFTSDFNEGWGAVLNESMNSGCAVVASHAIGAVPFLLENGQNGFIYLDGDLDDLYRKVVYLLENLNEQIRMGRNAYNTIVEKWNADTAAERFLILEEEIQKHRHCDLFKDGPCSKAKIIKNNWFKKEAELLYEQA